MIDIYYSEGNTMETVARNKLYQDALYWHLIGEGYTEYQAEVEAKRRLDEAEEM